MLALLKAFFSYLRNDRVERTSQRDIKHFRYLLFLWVNVLIKYMQSTWTPRMDGWTKLLCAYSDMSFKKTCFHMKHTGSWSRNFLKLKFKKTRQRVQAMHHLQNLQTM